MQVVREKVVEEKRQKAVGIRRMKKQLADDLVQSRATVEVIRRERTAEIRKQRMERHEKKEAAWVSLYSGFCEGGAQRGDEQRGACFKRGGKAVGRCHWWWWRCCWW